MMNELRRQLDVLGDLAGLDELKTRAARDRTGLTRRSVNAHVHVPPNFSAFNSVADAVGQADRENVRVLGVSNYYDYRVYGPFIAEARRHAVFPLLGVEVISLADDRDLGHMRVNDPDNPGRMYLCGKGTTRLTPMSARAKGLLERIRRHDRTRMAEMTRRLAEVFAEAGIETGLDDEGIIDRVVERYGCARDSVTLQERHLARAFQEVLFQRVPVHARADKLSKILGDEWTSAPDDAEGVQHEIRKRLMKVCGPAFVAETFLSEGEARQFVLELGGIPCYPTLADGADPVCEFEHPPSLLAERLKARDIHMVEFIPIRNRPEVVRDYVRAVRDSGIAVVAGTEHNTTDPKGLEPTCLKGEPTAEEMKDVFWEGACVVAAHQFLVLNDACGFVDDQGRPNPDYRDDEGRIQAFARLGASVIERFLKTHPEME